MATLFSFYPMLLGICLIFVLSDFLIFTFTAAWPAFLSQKGNVSLFSVNEILTFSALPSVFTSHDARMEHGKTLLNEMESRGRVNLCWKESVLLLRRSCNAIKENDLLRSQLALRMAACDSGADGRQHPNFHCGSTKSPFSVLASAAVRECVQQLSDTAYTSFVQYRLHADVLCAYLEEELYQQRTEAVVAALQAETTSAAHTLMDLRRSSEEVGRVMYEIRTLQQEAQEATSLLRAQLNQLKEKHASAFRDLGDAAQSVLRISELTGSSLDDFRQRIHDTASEAISSLKTLSSQSMERFAAVEAQTTSALRLIERVESVQQVLVHRAFSMQHLLRTVAAFSGVLLVTLPQRTSAARWPALAFIVLGLTGPPFARSALASPVWLFSVEKWFLLCSGMATIVVLLVAYIYVPPCVLQRQIIREEISKSITDNHQLWQGCRTSAAMIRDGQMSSPISLDVSQVPQSANSFYLHTNSPLTTATQPSKRIVWSDEMLVDVEIPSSASNMSPLSSATLEVEGPYLTTVVEDAKVGAISETAMGRKRMHSVSTVDALRPKKPRQEDLRRKTAKRCTRR